MKCVLCAYVPIDTAFCIDEIPIILPQSKLEELVTGVIEEKYSPLSTEFSDEEEQG